VWTRVTAIIGAVTCRSGWTTNSEQGYEAEVSKPVNTDGDLAGALTVITSDEAGKTLEAKLFYCHFGVQ
jgi:hypothetical protein